MKGISALALSFVLLLVQHSYAFSGRGEGSYPSATCSCGLRPEGSIKGTARFEFTFTVLSNPVGEICGDATGTIRLRDPGCRMGNLSGSITRVQIHTPNSAVLYGTIVKGGKHVGRPFRLKVESYPLAVGGFSRFSFWLNRNECSDGCTTYATSANLPASAITITP